MPELVNPQFFGYSRPVSEAQGPTPEGKIYYDAYNGIKEPVTSRQKETGGRLNICGLWRSTIYEIIMVVLLFQVSLQGLVDVLRNRK